MAILAKWLGVDFGECLMDGRMRRSHLLIGDTSKELGEPELSEERCQRWRIAKEKYGSMSSIMELHKPEVIDYVFDDHPRAAELFLDVEQKYMILADGARDALKYLKGQGVALSIVTAAKSNMGPIETSAEMRFLTNQNVAQYFDELITPRGKMYLRDGCIDARYRGTFKEDGTLYGVLVEDLSRRGIEPSEAVMMGDKEWADIVPAKKRGLRAILYAGYVCRGPSEADAVIHHFSELKRVIICGSK